MGQRLIMEIYENRDSEKPLLNVYYHWSAYTIAAYMEANNFIESLYNRVERTDSLLLDCVIALELVGARLTENERSEIKKLYNYDAREDNINRNNGLIAFTEKGMTESKEYGEGYIEIFLQEEEVNNLCLLIETEDALEDMEINVDDVITINQDLETATFDNIIYVIDLLQNLINSKNYIYRNIYDEYIYLIG